MKHIINLLKEQLRQSFEREKSLSEHIRQQSAHIKQQSTQLKDQTIQIKELTATIQSMEEAMQLMNSNLQSLKARNRGLGKLVDNKSEKITVDTKKASDESTSTTGEVNESTSAAGGIDECVPTSSEPEASKKVSSFNPKDRGNNNSRRKIIFDIETVIDHIYPDSPCFDKEKAKVISHTDSILYKFIPGKFIKHISRQYNCLQEEKVYSGKAVQKAPLLNSNYDSSFIAGMLQLRYIYSMPVERIVKYFNESGFDLSKPTAHSLISKAAGMMTRFEEVLKKTILEDDYLCMDETYYKVLTKEKNEQGKGVRKGYIWAALANEKKLVQYFYEKGSRAKDVFTNYIGTQYKGAIQSDGLSSYKIVETESYPDIIRLACAQHCKRKFLDIESDKDAADIVNMINKLYSKEHKIKEKWTPDKILEYRQEYAPPILEKLKKRLTKIQKNTQTLPKSPLGKAVNYMLGEFDALCNYILRHDYALDNNAIELLHRYISLSRRNSLFCGSHDGAKRTALIYSLACSCRLHKINTFEYFTDVLNQLADISPNAPDEVFVNLLPHQWKKRK